MHQLRAAPKLLQLLYLATDVIVSKECGCPVSYTLKMMEAPACMDNIAELQAGKACCAVLWHLYINSGAGRRATQ